MLNGFKIGMIVQLTLSSNVIWGIAIIATPLWQSVLPDQMIKVDETPVLWTSLITVKFEKIPIFQLRYRTPSCRA